MSREANLWDGLASEFEAGMYRDLSGKGKGAAAQSRRKHPISRTSTEPSTGAKIVVVEVPDGIAYPSVEVIRERLDSQEPLSIYYVVRDKHWAALGEREFNPDDPERGPEFRAMLLNLGPDYALLQSVSEAPVWCPGETEIFHW